LKSCHLKALARSFKKATFWKEIKINIPSRKKILFFVPNGLEQSLYVSICFGNTLFFSFPIIKLVKNILVTYFPSNPQQQSVFSPKNIIAMYNKFLKLYGLSGIRTNDLLLKVQRRNVDYN
jgi:hypothetical protein